MSVLDRLKDWAQVNISLAGAGLTLPGFGSLLIMGWNNQSWVSPVRKYSSIDAVAVDFPQTTPEYKAAQKVFSASVAPVDISIGKGPKPTMIWSVLVAASAPLTRYALTLNGTDYPYTSDATPTNDEIVTGLQAAIASAATAAGFTAAVAGTAPNTFITMTGNAAGNWCGFSIADPNLLTLTQTTADPGITTALGAISAVDDDYYGIVTLCNSEIVIANVAAWAEPKLKFYIPASQDTAVATTPLSGGTDIGSDLVGLGYFRTMAGYHPDNAVFMDAAIFGMWLPKTPGSETINGKPLNGVAVYALTDTWKKNLKDKNVGFFYTVAGRNVFSDGAVASGEWTDTIRFKDWVTVTMQGSITLALLNNEKIPYTRPGADTIENEIRGVLQQGVNVGGLLGYTVTAPNVAQALPADRAARILRGFKFTAELAGAVHQVIVTGNLV